MVSLNHLGDDMTSGLGIGVYQCEIPGAGGITITRYVTLSRGGIIETKIKPSNKTLPM